MRGSGNRFTEAKQSEIITDDKADEELEDKAKKNKLREEKSVYMRPSAWRSETELHVDVRG